MRPNYDFLRPEISSAGHKWLELIRGGWVKLTSTAGGSAPADQTTIDVNIESDREQRLPPRQQRFRPASTQPTNYEDRPTKTRPTETCDDSDYDDLAAYAASPSAIAAASCSATIVIR